VSQPTFSLPLSKPLPSTPGTSPLPATPPWNERVSVLLLCYSSHGPTSSFHCDNHQTVIWVAGIAIDHTCIQEQLLPLLVFYTPIQSLPDVSCHIVTVILRSEKVTFKAQIMQLTLFQCHPEIIHLPLALWRASLLLMSVRNMP
jgi:hypothetical protein